MISVTHLCFSSLSVIHSSFLSTCYVQGTAWGARMEATSKEAPNPTCGGLRGRGQLSQSKRQQSWSSWLIRMTGSEGWTDRSSFIQPCQIDVPNGPPIHPLLSTPTATTHAGLPAFGLTFFLSSLHTEVTLIVGYTLLPCLQLFDGFLMLSG